MTKTTRKYLCEDCKAEVILYKDFSIVSCPVCNKTNITLKEEELFETEK